MSTLPSNTMAEVAAERERQKSVEGWDPAHDDTHDGRELARAAGAYVQHYYERQWLLHLEPETYQADDAPDCWPWDLEWWKPKDARRDLIRAAALIVAEIERLDRKDGRLTVQEHEAELEDPRVVGYERAALETECVATPETSIDMAHSQAWSAFARRHGGEGPSLPSEDRWCDGYMCALLDIGRGKATELKASEDRTGPCPISNYNGDPCGLPAGHSGPHTVKAGGD